LPRDLPVPVLVALHIPAGYTEALAHRLDGASPVTVRESEEGGIALGAGLLVLARGGSHLAVSRKDGAAIAVLERHVPGAMYTPSVDHLFRSAAQAFGERALGVVLTGMGYDGLEGSRAIRARGGAVIVESAMSAVIYGMPRAVNEAGLANEEAPLELIVSRILARL
jgi:two-component system chemotaxis response regulator CheB